MRKDHPRGCGENLGQFRLDTSILGSPPRMRGKRCFRVPIIIDYNVTPADAGKTQPKYFSGCRTRDHPRGCGENNNRKRIFRISAGSPPQVRGKPFSSTEIGKKKGITPAGAGKTRCRRCIRVIRQDHPRRCGENIRMSVSVLLLPWITPAGAGKTVFERAPPEILLRITPAGAGKT